MLILKFVVFPSGMHTTSEVFSYVMCGFDDLLRDAMRIKNQEQFDTIY